MSDDFADAQYEAMAALREYGDPLTVSRPATGYDPATRKRAIGTVATQTLYGRVEAPARGNARFRSSETRSFERTVLLSPEDMTFEPAVGDLIDGIEGRTWRIGDDGISIMRGGGLVITIRAGLVAA